jgi:arylsulfatase A-like enzyme
MNNILVFFVDELRSDMLSCYGNKVIRTPNLDELAKDSIIFDNCYTPTALCSPARASLFTGVYPHKHQILVNTGLPKWSYCSRLKPEMTMLQDWVKEQNQYETAYFGKWHIGSDDELMASRFDHKGVYEHPKNATYHPGPWLGKLVEPAGNGIAGLLDVPMSSFPDVQVAEMAESYLENRKSDKPFLLYCAFPGPHPLWMLPEEFGIRYSPDDIPLWDNRYEINSENKASYPRRLAGIDPLEPGEKTRKQRDELLRSVLACEYSYIELVDMMTGRVIDILKKTGQYENTTIIFTADHGSMSGAHEVAYKGAYMYNETYKIPLLCKLPGSSAAKRTDICVNLMDITATIMHLISGNTHSKLGNQMLDGASFLPAIHNKSDWNKEFHYAEYHGDDFGHYSSRMITNGEWKLIYNFSDKCEMYDLKNDPGELHNLFNDENFFDRRSSLMRNMLSLADVYDDGCFVLWRKETDRYINQK